MKKFLYFLGLLLLFYSGLLIYDNTAFNTYDLSVEDEFISLDSIYIYGTHLNISGNYDLNETTELVLYNGNFKSYPININNNNFNLSDYINDGLYLDDIEIGKYYIFLRTKYTEDNTEKYKYYSIKNNTDYEEMLYYTMSNYNKKIVINSKNKYDTLMLNISNNRNKNIYDIVIDPGHGGKDPGACRYKYCETDFTMDIALKLKTILEEYGLKVKLTYEKDSLSKDEKLNEYGEHGRAVVPHEVNAKYIFSIHLNSSNDTNINGFELYTAKNINYDFAKLLSNNVITTANIKHSNNTKNKVFDGIYSRNFTIDDINESLKQYEKEKKIPYDFSVNSSYYYIIRETGGIVTGAYVDGRNGDVLENPYFKSNIGTEAYLLELGYLSNKNELNYIINNVDKYIDGIAKSIKTLYDYNQ